MTTPATPENDCRALNEVLNVIRALLGPEGCPWDREQTPKSLCDYLIEETYELVEGIRDGDVAATREELGDVMFLLLFITELHAGRFSLADMLKENAAKMIGRHPHVFGEACFKDREELMANWERVKAREKADKEAKPGLFASLPAGLPPLLKAYRINSKAARTGFTWESDEAMEASLRAEWREWEAALASDDAAAREEEFGDVLFTLVEYGRRKGIKASAALDAANRKFLARYQAMERKAAESGRVLADMSLDEKNALWEEVKGAR